MFIMHYRWMLLVKWYQYFLGDLMDGWGMTCSKVPQGGHEPVAAAARTLPLHIGHPLHQMSHHGTLTLPLIVTGDVATC